MSSTGRFDVPVPGGSLAVFRLGASGREAPAVLAVHGITGNSHSWLAVARALGGRVSLVAPDLRGRGRSNALPGPFGLATQARDMLAVLDHLGIDRAMLMGHSLGAFIVATMALTAPERVLDLMLVDGGLKAPLPADVDPQRQLQRTLGPTLERLKMSFVSREEYQEWWRQHPAFAGSDIEDGDLGAYANHDLVGEAGALRCSVSEEAVHQDAADLLRADAAADALSVPATLLHAPRGLQNEPSPFQPSSLVEPWVERAPAQRRAVLVPNVNHYTVILGRHGAAAVAAAMEHALALSPSRKM